MSQCAMSKRYMHLATKHRRSRRRYTISYPGRMETSSAATPSAPPAPPSTPTSLTPTGAIPPNAEQMSNLNEEDHLDNFLYILDYAPNKYKMKLKEEQRTDAELAELFNVVSLSPSSKPSSNGNASTSGGSISKLKMEPERGVSAMSRTIRKHSDPGTTKIFKMRHSFREFLRDTDEEDSISAPEFDAETEATRFLRLGRVKHSRWVMADRRRRRLLNLKYNRRMDSMIDTFDMTMNFNDV